MKNNDIKNKIVYFINDKQLDYFCLNLVSFVVEFEQQQWPLQNFKLQKNNKKEIPSRTKNFSLNSNLDRTLNQVLY